VVDVDCAEIRGYCVVATKYNGAEEQAAETAQHSREYCTVAKGKVCMCALCTTYNTHRTNYFNMQIKSKKIDFSIFHFSFLV
jgi:hypothetical protein